MSSIDIDNVTFCYRDSAESFLALEDISLHVGSGEFVCLIGHSGCGKSTLLSLLAGLAMPDAGTIKVDGVPVTGPSIDRAMVFQNYSLFPWMKVGKNVAFSITQASKRRGKDLSKGEIDELVDHYLEQVGMLESKGKYPFQLSGGMQQRVAIARALSMDSEILLLDEPFGALDARNRAELQRLMVKLWADSNPRKTVVFVTHDLDEALTLATKVVAMQPKHIEGIYDVSFPLPRFSDELPTCPAYRDMRDELMSVFYDDDASRRRLDSSQADDDAKGMLHYADIQGGA